MNNDLISRSELKKSLNFVYDCDYIGSTSKEGIASDIIETIDNAPTVDFEKLGESLRCQIRAEYGSCDDCELSCPRNELIKLLDSERPTGHWLGMREYCEKHDLIPTGIGSYCWCSKCEYGLLTNLRREANFCPNCGADMRQEEAENESSN